MKKSINYEWKVYLKPKGRTAWENHAGIAFGLVGGGNSSGNDMHIKTYWNPESKDKWGKGDCTVATITPAWQYPQSVSCFPNDTVYPPNAVDMNGGKEVIIRFPGRRYRLFRQVGA